MSFKCDNCGKGQAPGSKPHKHVITRAVVYKSGNVPIANGLEVVKEMKICGRCNLAFQQGIPLAVTKRQVAREGQVAKDLELRQQGTVQAEESIVARDLRLRRQAKAERREALGSHQYGRHGSILENLPN